VPLAPSNPSFDLRKGKGCEKRSYGFYKTSCYRPVSCHTYLFSNFLWKFSSYYRVLAEMVSYTLYLYMGSLGDFGIGLDNKEKISG
jgi:hypothetical protein